MPVSVGGPDLFFSYQKNGEKYSCYFCGGIFTKLWFLSSRCLFMGTAGEMILGQADCQTQHDCCYILHLKLLMLRPNDNCKIKLLFLKFRLKFSNRLIKLLRFKKRGNAKQVCNGKWTGCDLTSHRWLWNSAWKCHVSTPCPYFVKFVAALCANTYLYTKFSWILLFQFGTLLTLKRNQLLLRIFFCA